MEGSLDPIFQAAGSAFLSVSDTERREGEEGPGARFAKGQFLPTCYTFAPQNGPEDFAYVVDRIHAPGKLERSSLQKQQITEALEACGFRSRGLGVESSPRSQLLGPKRPGQKETQEKAKTKKDGGTVEPSASRMNPLCDQVGHRSCVPPR